MRVAVLAVLLTLPACTLFEKEPDEGGCLDLSCGGEEPDAAPELGDCGIPQLRVRGDVQIEITRTGTTEGCPYVYDRTLWLFEGTPGAALPIDTTDSPVEVQSSSVGDGYEEVPVAIALTDEWGVGP